MTEQILAIAPILPGQKAKAEYDIPPHTQNSSTRNEVHQQPPNQKLSAPASGGGDDLIDFGDSIPSTKPVVADKAMPVQHRTRSISLMDDDRPMNAMRDKMAAVNLGEPVHQLATVSNGKEPPLKRIDTQTSEVDAFFDAAEG